MAVKDCLFQRSFIDGFENKIIHTIPQGFSRIFEVGMACEDYNVAVYFIPADIFNQRKTIHNGHTDISKNQFGHLFFQDGNCLRNVVCGQNLHRKRQFQGFFNHKTAAVQYNMFIINNQNPEHVYHSFQSL